MSKAATLSARDVRDVVIDRLGSGAYPLGSKLPPARALAAEIGVHRNTVAKAYQWLEELGLVSMQQGRGTYVAALVDRDDRVAVADQVRDAIAATTRKARRLGVTEAALRRIVDEQIEATYRARPPRAAFVECNTADLAAAVAEIETLTGIRLLPLLLDDLKADLVKTIGDYDVIFTSLFHVKEVGDLLAPRAPELSVVGVYTQPDEQALGEIARISPGARVGIVCNTVGGGARFAKQITTFAAVTTKTIVKPTDDQVRRLAAEVETIVCSRSRAEQVRGLGLPVPIVPLPFHVSSRSASRIVEAVGNGRPAIGGEGRNGSG